jgi:hypothetical protein
MRDVRVCNPMMAIEETITLRTLRLGSRSHTTCGSKNRGCLGCAFHWSKPKSPLLTSQESAVPNVRESNRALTTTALMLVSFLASSCCGQALRQRELARKPQNCPHLSLWAGDVTCQVGAAVMKAGAVEPTMARSYGATQCRGVHPSSRDGFLRWKE